MIPIAISSNEAEYIRKLLRSQNRKKLRPNTDHLRHPRKIDKNQAKKVSSEASEEKEYQIIYKHSKVQESTVATTTVMSQWFYRCQT